MAKKFRTIEVTQADIDRAKRNQSARCVVATAIGKSIEGANKVSIDLQTIRFSANGERFVYLTPPAASGYVIAFDAGDPIHPFAFRLSEATRIHVRQKTKTAAGKERGNTRAKQYKAEQRVAKLEAAAATAADPAEQRAARAQLTVAKRQAKTAAVINQQTNERLAGEPWVDPDHSTDPLSGQRKRVAPPQTYKRAVRSYGSRILRINQAPDTPEERATRGGVTAAFDMYASPDQPGLTLE